VVDGPRPIVAISQGFADYGDYYGFGYGRPLLAAGALPVLLPYYEEAADRREMIGRADGLVLAGGRDIEAWRYGRKDAHPAQGDPQAHLDEIELDYARQAVERGVPVLGVCRGCQVLNVALGGTLLGDLAEFPGGGADHPGAKWAEWRALVDATLAGTPRPPHPAHPVDIQAGSLLAAHLGERSVVDSYHHQAVDRLGEGLEAVAWAPDGVIEAIEMPGARAFVLGVQWEIHEEWQDDDRTLGLWRAFVAACSARMREREAQGDPALAT
jgi:putative glutamine amidotransferase